MKKAPTEKDKQREKNYENASRQKLEKQKKALIKPNVICFAAEALMFIILMIIDKPHVIFDESSRLFSILLLIITIVPLISLVVIITADKTINLLATISLHQLCIVPLIIGWLVKYDEMKNCSSYHMLVFYFLFVISWLAMTTVLFSLKNNVVNSMEHK